MVVHGGKVAKLAIHWGKMPMLCSSWGQKVVSPNYNKQPKQVLWTRKKGKSRALLLVR